MLTKLLNLSMKTTIIFVFIVVFVFTTVFTLWLRMYQLESEKQMLLRERLQGNANMVIGVVNTTTMYTSWILGYTVDRVQDSWFDENGVHGELDGIFTNFNIEQNGVLLIENLMVFDSELNLVYAANKDGDTIQLNYVIEYRSYYGGIYTFPAMLNPESDALQLLFVRPVYLEGDHVATVALLSNAEVLHIFFDDILIVYDSFVSVADQRGTIIFTSHPDAYVGINVSRFQFFDTIDAIPFGSIVNFHSPVSGIEKYAFFFQGENHSWIILSFLDADTIDDSILVMLVHAAPLIAVILFTAFFVFFLVQHFMSSLRKLSVNALSVSQGNIEVEFNDDRNDELGQVSRAFSAIVAALGILAANFRSAENAMAEGSYRYSLTDTKLGGVFDEMLTSANNIIKQMQKSMEEARTASKAKSEFLATMSHEIRTPMNAIMGITQIELQKNHPVEELNTSLNRIYLSGKTLLGIINDILDMSRIETGKFELVEAEYDVTNLISETIQTNTTRIGAKDLSFILEVSEGIPTKLFGDELRIKQILNNVLSNAIKYTQNGYVKFTVSSFEVGSHTILKLMIEDTGQGFKPEELKTLFDAYTRFNKEENRSVEGTGLGLTITQRLVEMMHGSIHVESTYGEGSTFRILIKQRTMTRQKLGTQAALELSKTDYVNNEIQSVLNYESMPYGSVLVVDDVETNLIVAEGLLAPYNVKVETVTSGFDVLERIDTGEIYDVIFMDHMMPRMDGIETTKILRKQGYTGIIVALTANALVGNEEMFKSKGFDWYISKPIDIRQLDDALLRFIRDRRKDSDLKQGSGAAEVHPEPLPKSSVSDRLKKAIVRDIEKAIVSIKSSIDEGDVDLFITSVHAMKSAMANINEAELSEMARALEQAGHDMDFDYITNNSEIFTNLLAELLDWWKSDSTE